MAEGFSFDNNDEQLKQFELDDIGVQHTLSVFADLEENQKEGCQDFD